MILRWIRTSDRMPEAGQLAIVAIVNKAGVKMRDVGYYDHAAKTWILGFDDVGGDERITHWMPLPEVPEDTEAPPTNYERIVSMTAEEIVDFMHNIACDYCRYCARGDSVCPMEDGMCKEGYRVWLNKEAKA